MAKLSLNDWADFKKMRPDYAILEKITAILFVLETWGLTDDDWEKATIVAGREIRKGFTDDQVKGFKKKIKSWQKMQGAMNAFEESEGV